MAWRKRGRKQGSQRHNSSSEAQKWKAEQEVEKLNEAFCGWQVPLSYAEGSPNPTMLQDAAQAVKRELFNCAAAIWEAASAAAPAHEQQQKSGTRSLSMPSRIHADVIQKIDPPVDQSSGSLAGGIGNQGSVTGRPEAPAAVGDHDHRPGAAAACLSLLDSARHIKYSLQHHLCYCFFHCFESPSFGDISQVGLTAGQFQRPEERRHLLFQEYVRWRGRRSCEEQLSKEAFSSFHSGKLRAFVQLYTGHAADYRLSSKLELVTSFLQSLDEASQPEALSHAFTSLCKTVWMLHKLAMAFEASFEIVRVCAGAGFDEKYMQDEDGMSEEQLPPGQAAPEVAFMAMPGFILNIGDYVNVVKARVRVKESVTEALQKKEPPARSSSSPKITVPTEGDSKPRASDASRLTTRPLLKDVEDVDQAGSASPQRGRPRRSFISWIKLQKHRKRSRQAKRDQREGREEERT